MILLIHQYSIIKATILSMPRVQKHLVKSEEQEINLASHRLFTNIEDKTVTRARVRFANMYSYNNSKYSIHIHLFIN